MCKYIGVHVYRCACTQVCMYTGVHVHRCACLQTCMPVHACLCMHACACMRVRVTGYEAENMGGETS